MMKTTGIVYNPHKPTIEEKIRLLKERLLKSGFDVLFAISTEREINPADGRSNAEKKTQSPDRRKPLEKPDLLMVLGGDGSVLRSMNYAIRLDCPVIGINFGKFGFLTRFSFEKIIENPSIINASSISNRALLKTLTYSGKRSESTLALNDIVIQRSDLSQVEMYDIAVNGNQFEPKAADGVVISTPTGSTAYALSLGGPIVFPECFSMQLNLIAPHTIANRPIIFNSNEYIDIKLESGDAMKCSIDGLPMREVDKISVSLSEKTFKLACPQGDDLVSVIEKKLLWGRRG